MRSLKEKTMLIITVVGSVPCGLACYTCGSFLASVLLAGLFNLMVAASLLYFFGVVLGFEGCSKGVTAMASNFINIGMIGIVYLELFTTELCLDLCFLVAFVYFNALSIYYVVLLNYYLRQICNQTVDAI